MVTSYSFTEMGNYSIASIDRLMYGNMFAMSWKRWLPISISGSLIECDGRYCKRIDSW